MVFKSLFNNQAIKNLFNYYTLAFNVKRLPVLQMANDQNLMVYSNRIQLTPKVILTQKLNSLTKSQFGQQHMAIQRGERPPLALIFGWVNSKDKHLEKYRQLWLKRGFDVMTVSTDVKDGLVPPLGSILVAKSLVKILLDLSPQYNEVVVHAFSVGGYHFGQTLLQIRAQKQYLSYLDKIKGIILDSVLYPQECVRTIPLSLTRNPINLRMYEMLLGAYFNFSRDFTINYYKRAIHELVEPVNKYPGLLLYSKNDIISGVKNNEELAQKWKQLGINTRFKCWEDSLHVRHYDCHQKEYEHELDFFIKSLKLKTLKK